MDEDKKNIMAKLNGVWEQLDKSQESLECVAFEILNSSDSIMNSALKLAETLSEMEDSLKSEESKQAIHNVKDCLEELSVHIQTISVSAHQNEETFAEQRGFIEEIRQTFNSLIGF